MKNSATPTSPFRQMIDGPVRIFSPLFALDLAPDLGQISSTIEPGIAMGGVRMWMLLASCVIASIGLNTNSSAVIIGAMLISPLMGPILGLGFGMAIGSRRIALSALKNLGIAISLSLALASLYFLISPFQDPTAEILSRTEPNLLDLLVAIAAACAGVLAIASPGLAGAVPGVAIAIAIMPPLCSSAYGIAHGNWRIAFGAIYLFFVNAVAIAVMAFLMFKRMHFQKNHKLSDEKSIKPAAVSLAILIVVAPLAWSLWDAWRDNAVQRSVSRLIQENKQKFEIVSWHWDGEKSRRLVLYNFKKASPTDRATLLDSLRKIDPSGIVEIHESTGSPEMEAFANQIKSSQLSSLVNNPKLVEGLMKLATQTEPTETISSRLLPLERSFGALLGENSTVHAYLRSEQMSQEVLLVVRAARRSDRLRIASNLERYHDWAITQLPDHTNVKIEILP